MRGTIVQVENISAKTRGKMLSLHRRYYAGVTRSRFLKDLSEKQWAILLKDDRQRLVGFSTIQLILLKVGGRKCLFLFSGDTIVDRRHRLSTALAGCFSHFMVRLLERHRDRKIYWFLISKGYRTYRFLPVYFRRFYPNCRAKTPALAQRLIDAAARHKFNGRFDPSTGIICVKGQDRLKVAECDVPTSRERDPHVSYFLQKNLNYRRGDELACLAEISESNFTARVRKVILRTHVNWEEAG